LILLGFNKDKLFIYTSNQAKEDIFIIGLFSGMNPGIVANAAQGAKAIASGIANSFKAPSFSDIAARAGSLSDIEAAFFKVASKEGADAYRLLAPMANDGAKYCIIESFWKTFINPQ